MKSLLFILALLGSTSCLLAQKGSPAKISDKVSNVESSMDLTPDQIEAILQIENEFQAIQQQRKAENPAYNSKKTMLASERELKLRKILSPTQWVEYQKMQEKWSADEQQSPAQGARPIKGQKLKVID